MSGLRSDARRLVYSEDVVTYADESLRRGDNEDGYPIIGLVSKVAGQSDDESEESEYESDEEHEVRTYSCPSSGRTTLRDCVCARLTHAR